MKKVIEESDPINFERIKINIKVFFEDCDHGYKELYMITNAEILSNAIIDCQVSMTKSNRFSEVVYNDVINLAFRPKVDFERICASVMSFIGCNIDSNQLVCHIEEYPSFPVDVVAHINVDDIDESSVDILPNFEDFIRHDPYFDLTNGIFTSLCLPSKLMYLNHMERVFLFSLAQELLDLPKNICRWNYSQLLNFFRDQIRASDSERSIRDTLSGVIDALLFYDFIDLSQEDVYNIDSNQSIHYFIFSVRDINLYPEFFQILDDEQAA